MRGESFGNGCSTRCLLKQRPESPPGEGGEPRAQPCGRGAPAFRLLAVQTRETVRPIRGLP